MKKYNNKSVKIADWTTRHIEEELVTLRNYIDDGCFGVNDLRFECALASELDRRAAKNRIKQVWMVKTSR